MNWFKGLPTLWQIVIVVVIIAIIYYVYKKSKSTITQLTQSSNIVLLPNEPKDIAQSTQLQIQSIGKDIYNDIEHTPYTGHDYSSYDQALQLTDNQLDYLATYYYTFLTGGSETLYAAIDSQIYAFGDSAEKLQSRLAAIGKR